VKAVAFDVPPPGAGLNTVTCAVDWVATSAELMAAVSCVLLTNVVVRAAPFHCTTEPATKFVPFTCRLNPALPAAIVFGLRLVMLGIGLVT
jgi:hypothetical protein